MGLLKEGVMAILIPGQVEVQRGMAEGTQKALSGKAVRVVGRLEIAR